MDYIRKSFLVDLRAEKKDEDRGITIRRVVAEFPAGTDTAHLQDAEIDGIVRGAARNLVSFPRRYERESDGKGRAWHDALGGVRVYEDADMPVAEDEETDVRLGCGNNPHRILVIRRESISKWDSSVEHTLEFLEGEDPDEDYTATLHTFATQRELDAFCEGLECAIECAEDYVTYTDPDDIRRLDSALGLHLSD